MRSHDTGGDVTHEVTWHRRWCVTWGHMTQEVMWHMTHKVVWHKAMWS